MTTKNSQVTTKDGQAGDLSYDEWMAVLVNAFDTPGVDDCKSHAELSELTGLSDYMLVKRLRILLKSGKVEAVKALRRGPAGLCQRVFVYRLVKGK